MELACHSTARCRTAVQGRGPGARCIVMTAVVITIIGGRWPWNQMEINCQQARAARRPQCAFCKMHPLQTLVCRDDLPDTDIGVYGT